MQSGRLGTLTVRLIRRTVLLSAIAFISIVVALLLGVAIIYSIAQTDVDESGKNAAFEFDLFLVEIESDLGVVADTLAEQANVDTSFRAALSRHDEIFSMRMIDLDGNVLAQRRRGAVIAEDSVAEQPWLSAVQEGTIFVSSVDFEEFGVPFVTLALPIYDSNDILDGSLVAQLDLTALWQRVISLKIGDEGYAYVVDSDGQLLVYSDLALVRSGYNMIRELEVRPEDVTTADPLGLSLISLYNGLEDRVVVGSSQSLTAVPWYAVVEIPVAEVYRGYVLPAALLLLAILVTLVLVLQTVSFIRRSVARPLRNIIAGAQTFAGGDLSYRIETEGAQHELLDLSNTLNQMSEELEQSSRTLEARVEARTRDLRLASRVAEQIATVLDPAALLPQVVDLTQESFNLYHVHIYLLDEAANSLVLSAGAGEVGRTMRDRGHRIPASAELSLVARAARTRTAVVVADTSREPSFLPNPLLPRTRSEAALPLMVGGRVVGVMDVQSDQAGWFDEDLVSVLTTMARQIAVAINNASLFSEAERMARHEQALSLVTQAIQGATNLDEVLRVATRELGKALRVPRTAIELRVEKDQAVVSDPQPVD